MQSLTLRNNSRTIIKEQTQNDIEKFYNEATEDYQFWSKDFNMHFGYFRLGKTNVFRRDSMLNEMNRQVWNRINIQNSSSEIVDFGCGMGATMRYFQKQAPTLNLKGISISEFQVEYGNQLLNRGNAEILKGNYLQTPFQDSSKDAVIAMESLCHCGHSERAFEEANRVLKQGGKFVITDAFLTKNEGDFSLIPKWVYKHLCNAWGLPRLGYIKQVKKQLQKAGFHDVEVENISWRIAPSVLHVPIAIPTFILKKIWKGKKVKAESWKNLKGSLFALLSGLFQRNFGYFIITARK